MPNPMKAIEGGCRCDAVRIRLTAPPIIECVCHCPGCQRMSSSAFSLTAICPAAAFSVTKGEPVIGGLGDPDLQHFCCPSCLSWMFTRPQMLPDAVNVRPTMFDDHSWFAPYLETFTATKLSWVHTGAPLSFEHFPPMDGFGDAIATYRAWLVDNAPANHPGLSQ